MDVSLCDQFLALMHEYQKINDIKDQSIANAQLLFDFLRVNFPNIKAKVKPSMCLVYDEAENRYEVINHLVISLGGKLFVDPSYEIHIMKNVQYLDSFQNITRYINVPGKDARIILSNHVYLTKTADTINQEQMVIDKSLYYAEQHKYVWDRLQK